MKNQENNNKKIEKYEEYTDLGNAKLFNRIFSGDYKVIQESNEFLKWDEHCWESIITGEVCGKDYETLLTHFETVITAYQKRIEEIQAIPETPENKQIIADSIAIEAKKAAEVKKWWLDCQSNAKIIAFNRRFKVLDDVSASISDADKHSNLLGVKNGVVDIANSKLLNDEDAKNAFILQQANIEFDEDAKCPKFEAMVNRLMLGDTETVEMLKTIFGSAVLGVNSKYFYFFHGKGNNGKTTIGDIISQVLGDYSIQGNTDLFNPKAQTNKDYFVADWKGKRFIHFDEISKDQVALSEEIIKQTTDSGKITARPIREKPFSFYPQFTPIFTVNHLPSINNDNATWRRVVVVPFDYDVPDSEKSKTFIVDIVKEEGPGILNWLIEGAINYQKHGVVVSEKCKQNVKEVKKETDTLYQFLKEEYCDYNDPIKASDLRKQYVLWLGENGYRRNPTIRNFIADIRNMGIACKKSTGNAAFVFNICDYPDFNEARNNGLKLVKDKKKNTAVPAHDLSILEMIRWKAENEIE